MANRYETGIYVIIIGVILTFAFAVLTLDATCQTYGYCSPSQTSKIATQLLPLGYIVLGAGFALIIITYSKIQK